MRRPQQATDSYQLDDDYDATRASSPTSESESEELDLDSPISDDLDINWESGLYEHREAIRETQLLKVIRNLSSRSRLCSR